MDFRRLQAFCKVFEHQSFSRAAHELYLSQPTISAHIAALETELGVTLFDRTARTVIPTSAAQLLYSRSQEIFRLLSRTKQELNELKDNIAGDIIVGGSTIPANYLWPRILAKFLERFPQVCVDLRVEDSNNVCSMVLNGELDFGIVGGFYEHHDLEHSALMKDHLIFVAPMSMKGKFSQKILPHNLKDMPLIMREKGSGTRQAMEKALTKSQIDLRDLNVVAMVQSTEALIRCLLAGIGIGVTSRLAVQEYIQSQRMFELQVQGINLERSFYIIHHKRRSLFPATLKLINYTKKYVKELF
jgi:DNA-binding transcriptional LysR family regulator